MLLLLLLLLLLLSSPLSNVCCCYSIYSYGINLWELCTREVPFSGLDPVQVVAVVVTRDERPPIPADCPTVYAQLICDCWKQDPLQRPSFGQILQRLEAMTSTVH